MTDYWTLFAAIVAVVSAAAAALIKLFNVKTGWLKQVISWLVAIGLTFAGSIIGIDYSYKRGLRKREQEQEEEENK